MFYGCPFHRTYEIVRYQQNLVTYDICKKLNNRGRYREEKSRASSENSLEREGKDGRNDKWEVIVTQGSSFVDEIDAISD